MRSLPNTKKKGIIERITNNGILGKVHYLPHREVVKEERESTQVRIIFDASAKGKGPSLNDCLYAGPSLIASVFKIMLLFRVYRFGLIADIQQAFLQVGVHESHRDFLRFLFMFNDELVIYRFTVVIFGAKSSSFLLNGTIDCHMKNYVDKTRQIEENKFLVKKFLDSLYVDDYISGVDSHGEGVDTYKFNKTALKTAGFNLRKWYSNASELSDNIHQLEVLGAEEIVKLSDDKRVLGISWNKNDEFTFEFTDIVEEGLSIDVTKRNMLSISAKFFDPLGLISPIIVFFLK